MPVSIRILAKGQACCYMKFTVLMGSHFSLILLFLRSFFSRVQILPGL